MNRLHRALQRPLRAADLPISERVMGILLCVLLLSAPILLLSLLIVYTYYRHFYTHSLILPCCWATRRRTKYARRSSRQRRSFIILARSDLTPDEQDLQLKHKHQLNQQFHSITKPYEEDCFTNDRTEEASDKIYRLPPPGNGKLVQLSLHDLFQPEEEVKEEHSIDQQSEKKKFTILQWNACSFNRGKCTEIAKLAADMRLEALLISEVGNSDATPPWPTGFRLAAYDHRGRGIATFIRIGVAYSNFQLPAELQEFSDDFLHQAVRLKDDTIIVHVYIRPSTPKWQITEFFDILLHSLKRKRFIIAGDLNIKSRLFGDFNERCRSPIDNLVLQHDLTIGNDGSPTFRRSLSAIDITLASSEVPILWNAVDDLASDHFPCVVQLLDYQDDHDKLNARHAFTIGNWKTTSQKSPEILHH